ncbi:HNH endonuclease, partial [Escherichia coli]|nr:HNH endonuclease [Escherichia coli]
QRNLARSRRNKTGVTGVKQINGYFVAYIGVGNKQKYLSSTSDFFEAVCLRKRAEKQYKYSPRHGL